MKNKRTFLIRCLALALLLALAAAMMVIGRGHTVYFDNKKLDYNGQSYECPYKIEVYVKDQRVAKLYEKDRGMANTMGQKFQATLEITDEKGGDSRVVALTMNLPYSMDGIVLNLPALLSGLPQEAYLSEFVPAVVAEEAVEETISDEFGGLGDF